MSNALGFMIESLVAVLMVLTIGYCILLNRRLTRLKADEQSLKATISELITATEIAERAIGGLKLTIRECDQNLGTQIETAEQLSRTLNRQIDTADRLLTRITKIATAGSSPRAPEPALDDDAGGPKAVLAAAQAFSDRTRRRVHGVAA